MATTKVITTTSINNGRSVISVNPAGAYDSSTITKTSSNIPKNTAQLTPKDNSSRFDDYGLRRKTIEIGTWDMPDTASITVAHGLVGDLWKNIRSVDIVIRNDSGGTDTYYTDSSEQTSGAAADAGVEVEKIDATNVTVKRATGGTFDSTLFDTDSNYNRGWITVWYE